MKTITKEELAAAIIDHGKWIRGEPEGRRLTLIDYNLSWSNLSWSNLSGSKNIICVNVNDPRGYRPVAVWHGDHWRIFAGCRSLTLEEALKHWGSKEYPDSGLGKLYVAALRKLPKKPRAAK